MHWSAPTLLTVVMFLWAYSVYPDSDPESYHSCSLQQSLFEFVATLGVLVTLAGWVTWFAQ